jgi:iron-sulfur cluster repair protein YtfE (RIC family)
MLPAPSAVRRRLLGQHQDLRQILLEADRVARLVLQGNPSQIAPLRATALAVASNFSAHIQDEEKSVLPLLQEVDAWGPQRVRQLMDEHEAQRAAISALLRLEERGDGAELAHGMRALVVTILEDMRHEDRNLLGDAILRDDVVSIDQTDG